MIFTWQNALLILICYNLDITILFYYYFSKLINIINLKYSIILCLKKFYYYL